MITKQGIFIYTIDGDLLSLRYFWNNENWNKCKQNRSKCDEYDINKSENVNIKNYKTLIQEVLNKEFSDSFYSLPSPNFQTIFENCDINYDDPYKKLLSLTRGVDNSINLSKDYF